MAQLSPNHLALNGLRGRIHVDDPLIGDTVPRVAQRTRPDLANAATEQHPRLQIRRRVIPSNPRTPEQQAHRGKFAAAVRAWQELTPEQREQLRKQDKAKGLRGPTYNRFLSRHMRNIPYGEG